MTDDIVTRLRIESASSVDVVRRLDMKCLCCPCCEESCLYCETVGEMAEAADEIERLRAETQEIAEQLTALNTLITNMKTMVRQHLANPADATRETVERHLARNHMGEIMLWVYANRSTGQPRDTDQYADRRMSND